MAKDSKPTVWYSNNGERLGTFNGHNGAVWCIDVTRILNFSCLAKKGKIFQQLTVVLIWSTQECLDCYLLLCAPLLYLTAAHARYTLPPDAHAPLQLTGSKGVYTLYIQILKF